MRTVEESRVQWHATFKNNENISDLRAAIRKATAENPCHTGLRSVCWKAFLLFENLDRSTWFKTINNSRGAYTSLKEHLLKDLRNPDDLDAVDPLADDNNSLWNTLRQDEVLRAEIFQDVERCIPENLYFREPTTQAMLLNILFVFCKLNGDIGYRQGMHEILAPILWTVSRDAIDPASLRFQKKGQSAEDGLLLSTLDAAYIEHDAFSIFCIMMQTAKSFYEMASNVKQPGTDLVSVTSPIVERSGRIHEEYLHKVDPELAQHLTAVDVLPQIFVIKWIRLLFGREFPFEDVLDLWDIIFAEDPGLDLVDYICVAMLLRVRWQLLDADYNTALTLLLRYPVPEPPHGPTSFVDDAIYIKQHLNQDGGTHLISKYSGRPPKGNDAYMVIRHRRGGRRTPQAGSVEIGRTVSPLRNPAQFLQDQGIENILAEAAKGVYSRSEKWGLNKAFKDAMQGLQSSSPKPRGVQWSLDEGRPIKNNDDQLNIRIRALEERNKDLAKLLQAVMEDLSGQSKVLEQEKEEANANALTLAIAKLQYVHVYLEDSTLPLGQEFGSHPNTIEGQKQEPIKIKVEEGADVTTLPPAQDPPKLEPPRRAEQHSPTRRGKARTIPRPPPAESNSAKLSTSPPLPHPFHQSRPSLAQSSFSWMLGPGQTKSNFVSATPLSPGHERRNSVVRGKNNFLFGEDDSVGKKSKKDSKRRENEPDDDGFTLGILHAAKHA